MEIQEILEQMAKLLKSKSRKAFEVARTNFMIGQLLADQDLHAIYTGLSHGNISVKEQFLFDCVRVFKSLGSEGRFYWLNSRLKGRLSWWFLLNYHAKAPQGETDAAALYWEEKMSHIENALTDLDDMKEMYENLPESVRRQLDGLLIAASGGVPGKGSDEREVLSGPVTFGHIGDIQMCETFTTAGRLVIDAATGKNERLLDLQRCLDYAVDVMIERGCRVILVPGDVCETEKPTPNEQGCLRVAFEKAAAHCPVIACPGNHDLSDNPKDASALEFLKGRRNIHVIEKPCVLYLEGTEVNHEPSATWPQQDCMKIFVVPFPSKGSMNGEANGKSIAELNELASSKLRLLIENFRSQIDPRVPNVLLLHLTVAGADGATNEVMLRFDPNVSIMDLRGFDYVACDHIHKFQRIGAGFSVEGLLAGNNGSGHNPDEFPVAYYSGSIDRMDFNEENDPKGFIVGTFEGRKPSVDFVETPARRFMTLPVDFFGAEDWKDLLDPRTIYRVKGEVTKEGYEALKPKLREFPLPLLNKLTVKREIKVRDTGMTDDLKEEDALRRYLSTQATREVDQETLTLCLQEHEKLAVE